MHHSLIHLDIHLLLDEERVTSAKHKYLSLLHGDFFWVATMMQSVPLFVSEVNTCYISHAEGMEGEEGGLQEKG